MKNINSKPKIFLMHGTNDAIVSPNHLLEAKDYLKKCGLEIKTKLFKNCEHNIPVEGTSLGLAFLKKNWPTPIRRGGTIMSCGGRI